MTTKTPETLYLIDSHAQIFRAYYAIRGGLRSAVTGEPTHAVFGFTGMLIKLFSQFQPQYVIAATDAPGKTFRDDLYDEYKGTREGVPDDLVSQIPRVHQTIEMFGIPIIGVPSASAGRGGHRPLARYNLYDFYLNDGAWSVSMTGRGFGQVDGAVHTIEMREFDLAFRNPRESEIIAP